MPIIGTPAPARNTGRVTNSGTRRSRFKRWADRLDSVALREDWLPEGIHLVRDDHLRAEILSQTWPKRFWKRPPKVVPDIDFITRMEASELLKSRWSPRPQVNLLIARGILQPCVRASDGADGLTRSSIATEREWRRTASVWRRLRRRIGGILHWV